MDKKEIYSKVVKIIGPFSKNPDALAKISESTRILEDLKVNSARLVDIILAFEDEFKIEVDDDSADRIRTLGDAVTILQKKLK